MNTPNQLLYSPNIRLLGPITTGTFWSFSDLAWKARETADAPIVLELTTEGGDADIARRIALEVQLCRRWYGRQTYFVGKTMVYSAGITIMSAFPVDRRFLTEDAVLLVHERRIDTEVKLSGPMKSNIQILKEQLATMEDAARLERDGFEQFIAGSKLSFEELFERAKTNCYITAQEALRLGLIAGIV
jgi:ATP-dependent protease ClpP protease subunit